MGGSTSSPRGHCLHSRSVNGLQWLFLAGPAQSVHTRAAPLGSSNAMDLGSSKSLQATAMIPAWPRRPRQQKRPVDKTPIRTVSCTSSSSSSSSPRLLPG